MLKKSLVLALLNLGLTIVGAFGQNSVIQDEVLIKSWKTGNDKIADHSFSVKLTPQMPAFTKDITAISGRKFRLTIQKNVEKNLKGEHWYVDFREIGLDKDGKEKLGKSLLYREKPGFDPDKHFFPREDIANMFYPYEEKKITMPDGTPMIEWKAFYPIKTTRKYQIEDYYLVLKAGEVVFDDKDKTKTKSFEILVEFKNVNY
jgi:hypothetical protein